MEIGVWGDSITYGSCDTEALGWVGRWRRSLNDGNDDYFVYNRGVCGETSGDALKRFALELRSIKPDLVVLALGTNDAKYPPGAETNLIAIEEYIGNMQLLIKQAKVLAKKVLLVGAAPVKDGVTRPSGNRFYNTEILRYNEALKELADLEDVGYVDVFYALDPATDLSDDGVHPNAKGYEKMFEVIKDAIVV